MTLARFMNYILYTDKRPENISGARWCAMRKSAEKNFKKVILLTFPKFYKKTK